MELTPGDPRPKEADKKGIDLSQVDDEVSVLRRPNQSERLAPPPRRSSAAGLKGLTQAAKQALLPPKLSRALKPKKDSSKLSAMFAKTLGEGFPRPAKKEPSSPQPDATSDHDPAPVADQVNPEPVTKTAKAKLEPVQPSQAPRPAPSRQEPAPAQDSLETFRRRQTQPTPRRKQKNYRRTPEDSRVGLSWWTHHWSAVTWLGRSLWIGAFACAWVAISRCLDPAISDPKLGQVPYIALLGWLFCAGLALNQRIPRRFRWTGLILGAVNSVALALSWSFGLADL